MFCRISGILVSLFLLSACSSDDTRLRDLYDVGTGPEEFAVLPSKPLTIPNNLTKLPAPDASAGNLADPTPKRDLIEKLGGSIDDTDSISKRDKNLLEYVSRAGVDTNILAVDAINDSRAYMVGKRLLEAGKSPNKLKLQNLEIDLKEFLTQ